MSVPAGLAKDFKTVAKSMIFHAAHDRLASKAHYHARLATAEVKDKIAKEEYKHAMSVHQAAGSATHLIGVKARGQVRWADVEDGPCADSWEELAMPSDILPPPPPPPLPGGCARIRKTIQVRIQHLTPMPRNLRRSTRIP